MTKEQALYEYFNSVMTSYPAAEVPDEANMPYLTYTSTDGAFGEGEQSITVNIYVRTDSEAKINALARTLADSIGRGGHIITCDGGAVWLKRGAPWCQAAPYDDRSIKRRYINISAEFLTNN